MLPATSAFRTATLWSLYTYRSSLSLQLWKYGSGSPHVLLRGRLKFKGLVKCAVIKPRTWVPNRCRVLILASSRRRTSVSDDRLTGLGRDASEYVDHNVAYPVHRLWRSPLDAGLSARRPRRADRLRAGRYLILTFRYTCTVAGELRLLLLLICSVRLCGHKVRLPLNKLLCAHSRPKLPS